MKPVARWFGAAVAGWALLAVLMPRFERNYQRGWTRDRAVAEASRLARDFGIEIETKSAEISSSTSDTASSLVRVYPDAELLRALPPIRIQVKGSVPGKSGSFHADFFENGTPARWAGPPSRPVEEDFVLERFAGPMRRHMERQPDSEARNDRTRKTWLWKPNAPEGISARLETTWIGGALVDAEWKPEYSSALQNRALAPGRGLLAFLEVFRILWTIAAFLIAGWYALTIAGRRQDHLRFAARLVIPYALVVAASLIVGAAPGGSSVTGAMVLFLAPAAGFVVARGWHIRAWLGMALLGSRRWRASRVGKEALTGWLAGPLFACIPYLVGAVWPAARPAAVADSAWPWARGLALLVPAQFPMRHMQVLLLLAVLTPWLLRPGRLTWWKRALFSFAALTMFFGGEESLRGNYYAAALCAVLGAIAVYQLYRREGLLAAASTLLSSDLAMAGLVGGWASSGAWLIAATGFFAISATGAAVDEDDLAAEIARRNDPPPDPRFLPERHRLQTEFSVAAEVQRGLLPAEPPAIPGYSLAALCRPAREVGGDLFDFASLPDGRWLLCVADVSGKGVPASLYMTLTKGMLSAEAARTADVRDLARSINYHLHEAGRRRTFVTMSLVALDPRTHRAEVLRAGHNPPFFCQPSNGGDRFLAPPGIGMGLGTSAVFDRTLGTEVIEMEPGDILLLYSDGLTEAMDERRDLFGEDRMQQALRGAAGAAAAGVLAAVAQAVDNFTGTADPHDDLTIVVLKREPVS